MNITEFLTARLDEDEAAIEDPESWLAAGESHGVRRVDVNLSFECVAASTRSWRAEHIARHDPARVLAEVAAKRRVLAEVASWLHDYVAGDTWFSCAQAVEPHEPEATSGSGCSDERRAGEPCDCSLDRRREVLLCALAGPYADHPDFDESWRP